MGIKRCPYCRALVEEDALYCRQCGTQLLFPEDENIEEDIPGDKIVFDSEETPEKVILEEEREGEEMEEEIFEAEKLEMRGKEKEMDIKSVQFRRKKAKEKDLGEMVIEKELTNQEKEVEPLSKTTTGEIETGQEMAKSIFDFPTAELDYLTRSVDEGQQKIEDFLEFLKEKAADKQPEEALASKNKELLKSPKLIPEEEAEIPPWAESIRDEVETEVPPSTKIFEETPRGYSFEAEEEISLEKTKKAVLNADFLEPEGRAQPWQTDSGLGLPEKPEQKPLPFEIELENIKRSWEEEEMPIMMEEIGNSLKAGRMKSQIQEEEDIEVEEEILDDEANLLEKEKAPSRPFFKWLKAKIFDLLFIGILWFIAFIVAARLVDLPFFALLAASSFQAGVFFLLLFGSYLFLFRFFIGETLGDRLFSSED